LADATREEIVVEKDAVLRTYGLDQPSGAITFTPLSPEAKAQVLFFGNDNPTGAYAYAMLDGRPEVFLTWLSVKNAVLKDADALRDKAPWRFDPEAVESLESSQGGGFGLRRSDTGAWIVRRAGTEEPGLESDINTWLRDLSALRALRVPSEDGKGGAWGVAKGPRIRIRLKGGAELELNAGAAKGSEAFYAQGRPGSPVFELPASALPTLQKEGLQLCDRKAFRLQAGQVERFEVKRPQGVLTAVKSAGVWAWSPTFTAKDQGFDFDGFLSRFEGASLLKRLTPAARPVTPTATVFFYGVGGVPLETVEFGPKRDGGILAYSGERRWASVVAANLLDGLPNPEPSSVTPTARGSQTPASAKSP
jgi:hypothetical protein